MQTSLLDDFFGAKSYSKIISIVAIFMLILIPKSPFGVVFYFVNISCCIYMLYFIVKSIFIVSDQRDMWILLTLALYSYIFFGAYWVFYKYILGSPYDQYSFLHFGFLTPSFFILLAVTTQFIKRIKNDMQHEWMYILNDMLSIFLILSIFSLAIFSNIEARIICSTAAYLAEYINIILSFIILLIVSTTIFTTQNLVMHKSYFFAVLGSGIYACVRIMYSYDFCTITIHNTAIIDIIFSLAFFLMMCGSVELCDKNKKIKNKKFMEYFKWILLLMFLPFIFKDDINKNYTLALAVIFILHVLLTHYIKKYFEFKNNLANEQEKKHELDIILNKYTNELKLANLCLQDVVDKDYLTGLMSRSKLIKELRKELDKLKNQETLALFCINLRRFKLTNASYGHEIADKILINIGKKILEVCGKNDLVSRFGADEFLVAKKIVDEERENYLDFAEKLKSAVCENIIIGSYHFVFECAIGIETANAGTFIDVKEFIRNADKATYFAKQLGNANPFLFIKRIDEIERKKSRLEILLHQANFKKEFEVYYQPVFDLKTDKIVAVENFLRWHSNEFGFLQAKEFIDIIERSDLGDRILEFMLSNACARIKELKKAGIKPPIMSINITNKQSQSSEFIDITHKIIKEQGISPNEIEIEVGENIWVNNQKIIDDIFRKISEYDIKISVDNFGIGHSSLVFLERYNIERIKIAHEILKNINSKNPQDKQIVNAVIALANVMNIRSVAKNIKNRENVQKLKEIGCNEIQGMALCDPVEWDRLRFMLVEKTIKHSEI
ncbi:MAG: EAL domain-containing protein [Campylobacter sp.]|nr:EAL domain-containing protein [Campylobacter sp.]